MRDNKREIRILKRAIKRRGNKQRRRFLKDISTDPSDFHFGKYRSEEWNERNSRLSEH